MKALFVIVLSAVVAGCTTAEWIQTNRMCAEKYRNEIPAQYEQMYVKKEHRIEVPDGNITCKKQGSKTNCTQGTRYEYIPYTDIETVDLNAGRRNAEIQRCTYNTCLQEYGNADCDS